MIELNEVTARKWLRDQHRAADNGADYTLDVQPGWSPRNLDESTMVAELVWEAQYEPGVITGLEGQNILLINGGESYLFGLDVPFHLDRQGLRLAGMFDNWHKIGAPDTVGIDAAIAILKEAVSEGNYLRGRLAEYTAAHNTPLLHGITYKVGGVLNELLRYQDGKQPIDLNNLTRAIKELGEVLTSPGAADVTRDAILRVLGDDAGLDWTTNGIPA